MDRSNVGLRQVGKGLSEMMEKNNLTYFRNIGPLRFVIWEFDTGFPKGTFKLWGIGVNGYYICFNKARTR